MSPAVYLDYNATTPVAPEVVETIHHCLQIYGNPSSAYDRGHQAAALVNGARESLAKLIGGRPGEIVFTGCATESNNLALLGVARAFKGQKRHLVVSAVEHPAVIEPARELERQGWALTVIPVDRHGRVAPADVAAELRPDTALVSIMHANNEIGTLQPIAEIAELVRAHGALMHTDAAQSVGKVPVNVESLGVDLLTLAGHKFYATKGVGALYVRSGTPIQNTLFGAGQERGLRPGTENVPAIAGLGKAAELARKYLADGGEEDLRQKRDRLHQRLLQSIPDLALNGHPIERLPNTLHVSFPGVSGRDLLRQAAADISASVGSACHSDHDEVSGILAAMGLGSARARGAVRLSTGRMTSPEEIDRAADALIGAWQRLSLS